MQPQKAEISRYKVAGSIPEVVYLTQCPGTHTKCLCSHHTCKYTKNKHMESGVAQQIEAAAGKPADPVQDMEPAHIVAGENWFP